VSLQAILAEKAYLEHLGEIVKVAKVTQAGLAAGA